MLFLFGVPLLLLFELTGSVPLPSLLPAWMGNKAGVEKDAKVVVQLEYLVVCLLGIICTDLITSRVDRALQFFLGKLSPQAPLLGDVLPELLKKKAEGLPAALPLQRLLLQGNDILPVQQPLPHLFAVHWT